MNILSIQSHVAYGHVGNSAAVFALQRLGVEVWPIHTVQFSNHAGYDTCRGRAADPNLIRELMQGLSERDALRHCDGVMSGYIGSVEVGVAMLDAVAQVKAANARVLYCCDPVIGDADGGAYVPAEIAEFMRWRLMPAADIVTPNHFELEYLTGRGAKSLPETFDAIEQLRGSGPRVVLVTSLTVDDTPHDAVDLVACDDAGRWRLRTPRLPVSARGAGDAIAALFLAHYLATGSAAEALSRSAAAIFGVLKRTALTGASEMRLIDAQDELVNPSAQFQPQPV